MGRRGSPGAGTGRIPVGPGRHVNAADLDLAHVDKVAFEVSIDADGASHRDGRRAGGPDRRRRCRRRGKLGPPASSTSPAGRSSWTAQSVGPIPGSGRSPANHPAPWSSTARRDRRECRRRHPSPSPIDLDRCRTRAARHATHVARTMVRPASTSTRTPRSAPRSTARRSAERDRRHDLFPHIAGAIAAGRHRVTPAVVDTSRTTTTRSSWRSASATSTGDRSSSGGGAPIEIAESIVAELGPLPMVPVTVDLARRARNGVRGLERVHAGSRSRVARRGVRPARPRRSRGGRPHRSRSGAGLGVGQVVAAQSHVGRRPGARRPRPGRRLGGVRPRTAARSGLDPTT